MSDAGRVVATAAGELRVRPLSPEALQGLGELFPRLGTWAHDGGEALALAMRDGATTMHGLRTGYGWFAGERASVARRAALYGRMRMPRALARFRRRGFDGVVLAGACVLDPGEGSTQEGEMIFMHARTPLADGLPSEPLESWERLVGAHTTAALLTFVTDVDEAWKQGGIDSRTLTDIEPCPVDFPHVSWFADVVLVGARVVLVRSAIDDADPLLGALVEAGLDEVEWTPCGFLVPAGGPAA